MATMLAVVHVHRAIEEGWVAVVVHVCIHVEEEVLGVVHVRIHVQEEALGVVHVRTHVEEEGTVYVPLRVEEKGVQNT
jgi:hypothetical protein